MCDKNSDEHNVANGQEGKKSTERINIEEGEDNSDLDALMRQAKQKLDEKDKNENE